MDKENSPLVSVIVRSMERPSLDKALASLARQTHPAIEVIVVNAKGGPHTDVSAICSPCTAQLINAGGPPLGRSQAANAGLDAVRGDFFAFLDDDDTLDPEHFRLLLEFTAGQPENTVGYAGIRAVDGNDPEQNVLNVFAETCEDGKLLAGNFIPIHAPLVPRLLLATGIRFDETLDIYEDWDFWLQVSRHAKLAFSGQVSGTYFINGNSGANPLTVSDDTMHRATLQLYGKWLPRLSAENFWQVTRLYHQRNLGQHHTAIDNEQLKNELFSLSAQHQNLKTQLEHANQALTATTRQRDQLHFQHNNLQQQFHDAKAMLELIYRSRSWALTAPIRAAGRSWRALRGQSTVSGQAATGRSRVQKYGHLARFIYHAVRHNGGPLRAMRKASAILRIEGVGGVLRRLPLNRQAVFEATDFRRNLFHACDLVEGEARHLPPPDSLAVMAHVYYPELFPQIAQALAHMPWPYDLYISVTSTEARETVLAQARNLPRRGELEVRIVPNRGRDIAPLLVEFRKELLRHQYVLHLHTKKSLYSGQERQEWRSYLIDGLLGSERRIRQIFAMFARNNHVGIIYPDTFAGVPYWAHSWLQNRGVALSLAARLGIDIRHIHYMDAPMGSMFWARIDALRPLLDLNLGYEDFPEERGQTDGTLQHAIERFFVLAANRNGYTQRVMLEAEQGATLFLSPGRKNLEHYFAVSTQERILAVGSKADIVSFDIFDTLLLRPWINPGNLFSFMEDIVAQHHGINGFAELRRESERLARLQQDSGDAHIEAIYSAFASLCGDPAKAAAIRDLEESLERQLLLPRPDVCAAAEQLKAKGKRVVLASDMYLDKRLLQDILEQNGLQFHDALYVSSDLGRRKDRGDMWPEISEREQVAADNWQHVGDNEHSDLQIPLDAGFPHPVHVMRNADLFMLFNEDAGHWMRPDIWQEGLFLGLLANRFFAPGLSAAPITQNVQERSVQINSLKDFGYAAFGPALAAFMAWLIREARQDGITQLLYASREGHLLLQAHELIARHLETPAGSYFLSSRRAALGASIQDPAAIDILLGAHFKGSFADFLKLRLGVEDLTPYRERLGSRALDEPGELPERTEAYRRHLLSCMDILETAASAERAAYQAYADQTIGTHRAALVDIGYSGTIQRALQHFLENIAGGYYFVTTEKSAEIETGGHFAKGCFGHQINAFHSDIPLYQFSLLSEAILTAPHGQLIRFETRGDQQEPRFKAPGLAQAHFADIDQIHQGALAFLQDVLRVTGAHFPLLAGHTQTANLAIRQVMEYRWKLGLDSPALHVEDNYSGNQELSIVAFYDEKRKRLPGTLDC
ncbi:MAG: glycosyltransferase [Azovibrio sp.]|nr:glycosyltransferase [Azovibrio sp.]